MRLMILLMTFTISLHAQVIPDRINCKCIEKINKDYGPEGLEGESKWLEFEHSSILRDKIFINLSSDTPIVKSIVPPDKYNSTEIVYTFNGEIIHRTENLILIKWENTTKNQVWIASINLELKKVIVTETYDIDKTFGVNIEILECDQ